MRILYGTIASSLVLFSNLYAVDGAAHPVRNLHVTLRGKKYDVDDSVLTVNDLQESLKKASGIDPEQQGRVLFGGKRLEASDFLSDVGVSDGAQLNMVPSSSSSGKSKAKSSSAVTTGDDTEDSSSTAENPMKEYLKMAGIDPEQMEEMMKELGSGPDKMPNMQESLEMMTNMMKSPIFEEYMNDPEKLEQSRQMILNNPMLKSMMAGMPGMEELLNDPVAWRDAMQAAANMYKNMDPNMMMQMMGGAGGMGGLFDGNLENNAGAAAALDELEEDD